LRGLLAAPTDRLPSEPDPGWRTSWPRFADLGVTAFCVPEDHGGFGFRVEVAAAAAMEFGAALHGAPFAGLTAGAYALSRATAYPARDDFGELVSDVVAGRRICCFGMFGSDRGVVRQVDGAPDADALVVLDPTDAAVSVFTDRAGWSPAPVVQPFDVSRSCADVSVNLSAAQQSEAGRHAEALFRLLLSADSVGGLERVLDQTVRYASERQAFGRAIGGFQAVQHRLVDHALRVRGMTLLVTEAARAVQTESAPAERSVALAEVSVHGSATSILHDLLQLTGAIGFSWEYGLHFYERRAHQNARLAAGPRAAEQALALAEGWLDAH
jgi:alkylation response protein AidB-like acyl-CoA dehydrogenase